jgi:hypothetical protein
MHLFHHISLLLDHKEGIVKPNSKYALISLKLSATIPREPHSIRSTLAHPSKKVEMIEELETLQKN